jgi:subtilisin family serine protease
MPNTPFVVPPVLSGLVERAYPQIPPVFFASPVPPRVTYHHLRVPADVSAVLRSALVHKDGTTGKGVLVVMPDTGFYKHPFYSWHGYNYQSMLSPDATSVTTDEVGHGTAEAANLFATAPSADFVGIKMGANATLAFKTAADLYPAVMTNSWGYDNPGPSLANFLKPLEAAVIEAVRTRGITACFAAGNGHCAFPGQMPEVISVGGAFAHEAPVSGDFDLEASNYASAFDSSIYAGRHVPDVCGLVGMKPRATYILLPVQPGDAIDVGLADVDGTSPDDGWAVISGTSAAAPQVAGICALLKQVQPGLSPELTKSILKASSRDVLKGTSGATSLTPNGVQTSPGYDGATGAGLVDAFAACQLARSISVRDLLTIPAPR